MRVLNIASNSIDFKENKGSKFQRLLDVLPNSYIEELNISDNNIDDEMALKFGSIIGKTRLKKVDVSCNSINNATMQQLESQLEHSKVEYINVNRNIVFNFEIKELKNITMKNI